MMDSVPAVLERLERLGKRAPHLVYGALGRDRVDRVRATLLARTSKRLDLCAAQLAHVLHLTGVDVRGRTCLELGSGWVLSHAVLLHLLGARRVIASDLSHQAKPEVLRHALRASVLSIVRDVLSPFEEHGLLRERMDALAALPELSFEALAALGIDYVAPLDLAREAPPGPIDVVYSNSVLEHVAADEVPALLQNLAQALAPGGAMVHAIHLEDHRDFSAAPFAFLSEPAATYGREQQNQRGNRLRASQWLARLGALEGLETQPCYAWQRDPRLLPARIDEGVDHTGPDDLRTSHLGVVTRRPA